MFFRFILAFFYAARLVVFIHVFTRVGCRVAPNVYGKILQDVSEPLLKAVYAMITSTCLLGHMSQSC